MNVKSSSSEEESSDEDDKAKKAKVTSDKILLNPLECRGNYSATPNDMKLVHWPLMGAWALTFGTARKGLGEATARPGPSSLYQM